MVQFRAKGQKGAMENVFFGREDLMADMLALWHKRVPSFVTCRGRRRIGKSTLIERFSMRSGARFIKIEGLRPKAKMTAQYQLANFANQLAVQTGAESTVPQNWLSAFVSPTFQEKTGNSGNA